MSFIKKVPASSGKSGAAPRVEAPKGLEKLEALLEFLTLTCYDDGSAREPGTISIFYGDGVWKASINDRDQERTAYVTATHPRELAGILEGGLREDRLDWRAWKKPGAKKVGKGS